MSAEERRTKGPLLAAAGFIAGLAICLAGGLLSCRGRSATDSQTTTEKSSDADPVVLTEDVVARIEAFCGDCHAVPLPDSFPRYAWHKEIILGYAMYAKSRRQDLIPPTIEETYAYYRQRAPEQLTFPAPADAAHPLAAKFEVEHLSLAETDGVLPAVSNLSWLPLDAPSSPELVVADMRRGTVIAVTPGSPRTPRVLANLDHPCHVEACDLDRDGMTDLIVADLGSMAAIDHQRGRVVWLRRHKDQPSYEPVVIASDLGRVADVRSGDFDKDGDLDLLVAVFGLDRTGDTRMLWNVAEQGEAPRFKSEVVDPRPGAIHVPPFDFDSDGFLDFASLISQECEQVAVFMNQLGTPQRMAPFHMQSLWEGPDLTFGSSGIQLVDLDADQDMDLLYTNGDAFDNSFVNPRHGVQWLENRGRLTFEYHQLTDLVGACASAVADVDKDGDLDILATSWLPAKVEPTNVYDQRLASIICLEQTAHGEYARHTLEHDSTIHATLSAADFDADGDVDFAVGYHGTEPSPAGTRWIDIWWNR